MRGIRLQAAGIRSECIVRNAVSTSRLPSVYVGLARLMRQRSETKSTSKNSKAMPAWQEVAAVASLSQVRVVSPSRSLLKPVVVGATSALSSDKPRLPPCRGLAALPRRGNLRCQEDCLFGVTAPVLSCHVLLEGSMNLAKMRCLGG